MRTERLLGEPIGPEHLPVLVQLWSDPRVTATLGGPRDEARLRADIDERAREWEEHGYGLWAVFDAETGAPVGRGGLAQTVVDGRAEVEVAYALLPEWWDQGLATELARASVAAAAGAGIGELVGLVLPGNIASQRVLERVGFTCTGETVKAGLDHHVYRLGVAVPGGFAAGPLGHRFAQAAVLMGRHQGGPHPMPWRRKGPSL